ncbi:lipoprotein 17-related variable surface protein [Mycoplasmopsis agassizii]|uniref:lipoprotein 17-related variable surface protein n=1 Tax=Mycoplasmopsis agassizii TaxID=33922 RepID=UPI003528F5B3
MWSTTELELVESGSNDTNGTLKVKVYLKQDAKYYTATGELVEAKDTAGKEVTLSGFKNTSQELEAKAKEWYDALKVTLTASDTDKVKLASEFATVEKVTELVKDETTFKAPTTPQGFTVSFETITADNTTGTLKFKALLKNGENSFDGADGTIKADASGKEVSVTGFTSEQTFALNAYKTLTEPNLTFTLEGTNDSEALKAKLASAVVEGDYTTINTVLANRLEAVNTDFVASGFKFEIIKVTPTTGQTNWDNTAGSLQVQLLLSSGEGESVKYWKFTKGEAEDSANASVTSQTTKDGATGRDANVTGFTTGQAYLSTQLAAYTYKTVAATDVENLKSYLMSLNHLLQ